MLQPAQHFKQYILVVGSGSHVDLDDGHVSEPFWIFPGRYLPGLVYK